MNFFNLFCKKKLQEIPDDALDNEIARRRALKLREKHKLIIENVKLALEYLDDTTTVSWVTNTTGSITISYKDNDDWKQIYDILNRGMK
jgi:hypothetical protein